MAPTSKLCNQLLDKGVITGDTFTATLLMAIISTMLSVPMVAPKLQKLKGVAFKAHGRDENAAETSVVIRW